MFGMLCETRQVPVTQNTKQWWSGNALPCVEQEGVQPMPKDRGEEQRDVDGRLDCSLALVMVAAEARLFVAVQYAARTLTWIGAHDSLHERRPQDEQHSWQQRIQNFHLGGLKKLIGADDPRQGLQENSVLADQRYLDDHPLLVLPNLQAFDTANAVFGAERSPQKTEVICYTDLDAVAPNGKSPAFAH